VGGGYVLGFSNRTFEEFVNESVNVNIFDSRYEYGSGSKANRLRKFWKIESNDLVGKIIIDLIHYAEFINKDTNKDVISACRSIADRLLSASLQSTAINKILDKSIQQSVNGAFTPQPPRVFISYSWDNNSHKDWVRYFADELIKTVLRLFLINMTLVLEMINFIHGIFCKGSRRCIVYLYPKLC